LIKHEELAKRRFGDAGAKGDVKDWVGAIRVITADSFVFVNF
jgi:hypothetical protein